MKKFTEKIERIEKDGVHLSLNSIMNEAVKYYPKTALPSGLAFILLTFLISLLSILLFINQVEDATKFVEQLTQFNPASLSLKQLSLYIIALTLVSALGSILNAGLIQIVADVSGHKIPRIKTAFRYFTRKEGLYIFMAHFTVTLLFNVLSQYLQIQNLTLVSLAINWLINTLIVLVTPLIIFDQLSPWQAIRYSIQVVNKKPATLIFILILTSFLVGIGALFFIVGLFFTVPFLYCIYFAIYNQTIGYSEETTV